MGCDDQWIALQSARLNQLLLTSWNIFMRNLHAEVAASDHDRIGKSDDVIDVLQGGGFFNLRHDAGAVRNKPAGLDDVSGLLYERQGNPIDAEFQPECKIGSVFRSQRGQI